MDKHIEQWRNSNAVLYISLLLSLAVTAIVYLTGGTTMVYSHLMYVPIVFVASAYGRRKGVLQGILSGLLIGPFMPLNVSQGITQEPINWIIRLALFATVAFIIGFFSDYDKKHRDNTTMILTHNMITGLKNLEAIKSEPEFIESVRTVAVINVRGISETINVFGYNFRDHIVKNIAARLKELISGYDNAELYYYSELQFILKITEKPGSICGKDIIENVAELNKSVLMVDNIPIYIEIQMGTSYIEGAVSTYEGLRRALIACSNAKLREVRSVAFSDELETYYKNILEVANDFSLSLENHSIGAAYQQIVSAGTGRVYSAEMLARWNKEDGTCIRPDFFIPIIEKTDLIHELTKYMITRAVDYLRSCDDENCFVSINFSLKDFSEERIEYLIHTARSAGIDPKRIQIEVVERTLEDVKNLKKYLEILKRNHIQIALDDFGTGYSSYQYVSELPIDVIKIDKTLIRNIIISGKTKSLVESIVKYCGSYDIKTVAEGVETKEIADICREIGFDYLQGYYYHRPQILSGSVTIQPYG